jgi:Cu(I)/Ag(I) efflux system membrane fusion protein
VDRHLRAAALYRSACALWYPQTVPLATWSGGRRAWCIAAAALLLGSACTSKSPVPVDDGTMLSPYLAIGEHLAADELDELAQLGAKLVAAAEPHASEPGVAELLAAAGRIGASDIATARLAYRKLSEGLIEWLAANPQQRAGLLLVFCPMAFNNQGAYWVQRDGELANPYEGAMMLRCGAKLAWTDHRRGAPPLGETKVEGMP